MDKNMWRNIAGQSVYQIAWLLVILCAGKEIFNLPYDADTPFPLHEPSNPPTSEEIMEINKTTVYTILFQAFVFMQIFNQINCRKLGDKLNVFEDFFNNWIFLGILVITFVVQMLLVEFGGLAVRC